MVEESTAAITEMIASLDSVNTITQNKRRTTEGLNNIAVEGKERIDETSEIFRRVGEYIGSIQEMVEHSKHLDAIVKKLRGQFGVFKTE